MSNWFPQDNVPTAQHWSSTALRWIGGAMLLVGIFGLAALLLALAGSPLHWAVGLGMVVGGFSSWALMFAAAIAADSALYLARSANGTLPVEQSATTEGN